MNDQTLIARRALLKAAVTSAVALPLLGLATGAGAADAPLVPLTSKDPIAQALGYVEDSATVDAKANPAHTPEQMCATCVQFKGKPGDARGGCNIFAGKSVNSKGWCKTWTKNPALAVPAGAPGKASGAAPAKATAPAKAAASAKAAAPATTPRY